MEAIQTVPNMKRENRKKYGLQLLASLLILITPFLWHSTTAYAELVDADKPNPLSDLEIIVANIIGSVVALGGIAVFVMLVAGGLMYLTSGGNPESVQKAKRTLTYAVIGIALFVLAWFALLFIQTFTGVKVTIFTVPS
ncbi:MAG: hypothetical protein A2785_03730 [Candidatus Chisholmbacteria bacterium RIFCSPHIGHO2_01_FULL_49_18]|uniref:Uncharacterized protein n=2 Tax=Candidatus Chisholmiibacteriota TaxID=1817900 RepID=A0A1G1VN68_9BACT|nr:MAG: hypothetical protein A2785_03730 [Candidatus Chisholmbacteria bacterium RIFCSPHIGHO2_01_FULL_49_18]OGY19458.1 MAG: hypothetical protein A3A65_06130 [Candidatus Chisholmbacteria bacterium RIFCSPLOWO2_01_FULL_49_14]